MRKLTFILFTTVFLFSCSRSPEIVSIQGYAQGTTYSIKYWLAPADEPDDKNNNTGKTPDTYLLKQTIDGELARIDKLMSNYREDSVIELFNQKKISQQRLPMDSEIMTLLTISDKVYQQSQHCYDPTIKPLFQIWGFSDDKLSIPSTRQIQQALTTIGFDKLLRDKDSMLKKHPAVTVDLSAIGQGYAVTQIAQMLNQHHIDNYMVEIGGEMLVAGTKPEGKRWTVGIERPVPNSQVVNEIIKISGKQPVAVMTSGTYRHYFDADGKQYSHILDPRTGQPVQHQSVSVTVLMDNATVADAWSTALLCLGSKAGLTIANQHGIAAIFYDLDEQQQLQRLPSKTATASNDLWEIVQ